MQAEQVRSEGTRYHFTEQQVCEEFVRMGMQQEMAVQFANRYCHSGLTHLELEYLEKNFNVRMDALESRIVGVEARLSDLKDDIKKLDARTDKLDARIDILRAELKEDIKNVKNDLNHEIDNAKSELSVKIDSIEKSNKWIFGLTFTVWITTMGGFIALFVSMYTK
ncbi:Bdr family repetitive protein [Borrelia sp. P9F1]|uniref:Bdr family repetitive protein n=1 Tax=Borrelia sp. P9F1 TaxID=3058374 RepID=UPI00264A26F2|nr:Bdr family repetitive protein [Borrelia sp. P9F1]WKC58487.1 Bdr family repetitive protein [Borrelia sp. P9F1]